MRTNLQFRLWNNQKNYFWYPNPSGQSIFSDVFNNKEDVITQYIGIDDKNGQKIYEGDIVSFKYQEQNGFVNETVGTVVFSVESSAYVLDNPTFKWENMPDIPMSFLGFYQAWEREVIGNVFEGVKSAK